MVELQYVRPAGVEDALTLLNEPGVKSQPLAGSTDLALLLRADPGLCDRVVDISLIPELHRIARRSDQVTIGAAATFSEVLESPLIQQTAPVLVQACRQVGAVQIRNMGTLGGNVCNAAACADSLPALVCLDAIAHVRTLEGEHDWPVSELVVSPNHTNVPPGGLLVSFQYRIPSPGSRSVFLKLGRRNALAISRLTVAVLGRLDEQGRVAEVRIAAGAAMPRFSRFTVAEDSLIGQFPTSDCYVVTAHLVVEEMIRITGPRWSTEFKEPALVAMVCRALAQVFEAPVSGLREGA
jgi:CO/xanthine dehydrogenase FAD-binding subunit